MILCFASLQFIRYEGKFLHVTPKHEAIIFLVLALIIIGKEHPEDNVHINISACVKFSRTTNT